MSILVEKILIKPVLEDEYLERAHRLYLLLTPLRLFTGIVLVYKPRSAPADKFRVLPLIEFHPEAIS